MSESGTKITEYIPALKPVIKTLRSCLVLLIACTGIFAFNTPANAAFLGDWDYSMQININNTGSKLNDYQFFVSTTAVDTKSLLGTYMESDYADLRFADENISELSYWIDPDTTTTTGFWVRVSTINASGTTIIYKYYGNTQATSASRGSDTFIFFDDFKNGNQGWTAGEGAFTITNGRLLIGFSAGNGETQAANNYFGNNRLRPHRENSDMYTGDDEGNPQIAGIDWGTGVNHKAKCWWWCGGDKQSGVNVTCSCGQETVVQA